MAKKLPVQITPRVRAGFSKFLYERDTKFAKDDAKAKYSFKVMLPKDEVADMVAAVDNGKTKISGEEWIAQLNQMHADAGGKDPLVKDGDQQKDKEGNVYSDSEGCWVVQMKSGYAPKLVDTKKNDLGATRIFGGDIVKVAFRPDTYEGFGGGVTLYLNSVMLIEKNSGDGASAFGDDEEGYVADQAEADVFGDAGEPEMAGADNAGDY